VRGNPNEKPFRTVFGFAWTYFHRGKAAVLMRDGNDKLYDAYFTQMG
jgi:hypothetical protein